MVLEPFRALYSYPQLICAKLMCEINHETYKVYVHPYTYVYLCVWNICGQSMHSKKYYSKKYYYNAYRNYCYITLHQELLNRAYNTWIRSTMTADSLKSPIYFNTVQFSIPPHWEFIGKLNQIKIKSILWPWNNCSLTAP